MVVQLRLSVLLVVATSAVEAFIPTSSSSSSSSNGPGSWRPRHLTRDPYDPDDSTTTHTDVSPEDTLDLLRFHRRHQQLRAARASTPDPLLDPRSVVTALLTSLKSQPSYYEFDPLRRRPHPGVQQLWQTSTGEWQQTMARMVGGGEAGRSTTAADPDGRDHDPEDHDPAVVAALGRYWARPSQQFAILLGVEDANYELEFPTDVIEWSDDKAWLEGRLRDATSGTLLVVLGWTFQKLDAWTSDDRAWFVHSMDWQDFRPAYRPGLGREEWERICG